MRFVIKLVAAVLVLYCGYWFVGSRAALTGIHAALDDMRARGVGDAAAVTLGGFPSRFDITIDQPVLTGATTGTRWSAPFLQVFALSYRPNHIIAVWPPAQQVELARDTIDLATTDMRASVVTGASPGLPLDHATLIAAGGQLRAASGWGVDFAQARLASRLSEGELPNAHDIGLEVLEIAPVGALAVPRGLPDRAEKLRLDATLSFDRAVDRHAIATGLRPQVVVVRDLSVRWGDLDLAVEGRLEIGPDGMPDGRLSLKAQEWRAQLQLLVDMGVIPAQNQPMLDRVLGQVALLSGAPDRLDLPLDFRGGRIFIGPVPLGPAPRF